MKKLISSILCVVVLLSGLVFFTSCDKAEYKAEYKYSDCDIKITLDGQEIAEAKETTDALKAAMDLSYAGTVLCVESNKITMTTESGNSSSVYQFEKKDGKMMLKGDDYSKMVDSMLTAMGAGNDVGIEDMSVEIYVEEVSGGAQMVSSVSMKGGDETMKVVITLNYKK